jgi:hypothetical protein
VLLLAWYRTNQAYVVALYVNFFFHQGLLPEFHYQDNEITRFQQQGKEKDNTASSTKPKHRTKTKRRRQIG